MTQIRLGAFNCENLVARYKFAGPRLKQRKNESEKDFEKRKDDERAKQLDKVLKLRTSFPLEWLSKDLEAFKKISGTQRKSTAAVIKKNSPDIMALEEVESMEVLRTFNTADFFGNKRFKYAMLIEGNDPRGIDVAVLSNFPMKKIRSYADEPWKTYGSRGKKTFSRDCLVVTFDVEGKELTLFINHLKSQIGGAKADTRRASQAVRVAEIVKATFASRINREYFAVVGDFNQAPDHSSLKPLLKQPWHTDIISRLPESERWTYVYEKNGKVKEVKQLDYLLLSKALESKVVGGPYIERRGLARYGGLDAYYPDSNRRIDEAVDKGGTEASDHCPVFVDVDLR